MLKPTGFGNNYIENGKALSRWSLETSFSKFETNLKAIRLPLRVPFSRYSLIFRTKYNKDIKNILKYIYMSINDC